MKCRITLTERVCPTHQYRLYRWRRRLFCPRRGHHVARTRAVRVGDLSLDTVLWPI